MNMLAFSPKLNTNNAVENQLKYESNNERIESRTNQNILAIIRYFFNVRTKRVSVWKGEALAATL